MNKKIVFFIIYCIFCSLNTQANNIIKVPSSQAKTIEHAILLAKSFDTIIVSKGIYYGNILLKANVTLKSENPFEAILDGGGRGTIVTLGGNSSIIGFEIRNGTIGISSSKAVNNIINCKIIRNNQCGIICIGDLPLIQNNIIAFNKGSGILGRDVFSQKATISNNTIAYNNNGISLSGNSNVIIEKNIIAFNQNFAIKHSENAKTSLSHNDFFKNGISPSFSLENNYNVDPKFISPIKELNFSLNVDSPLKKILFNNNQEEIGAIIKP